MALTWEDRFEITELGSRMIHASDKRDAEVWLDLYDADGWLEANGKVLCRGREEIAQYIERAKTQTVKRRHWTCNPLIEAGETENEARFRSYVSVYDITDGVAGAPYLIGEYDDIVTKASGRWKFKARRLTTIAGAPKTV